MIKLERVTKKFGKVVAVDNLSFEIEKGKIVGLLGPNGAGKTTLMRLITGFFLPDQGEIFIKGIKVTENPYLVQKMIGYLPENNPLYEEFLVFELLSFFAKIKQIGKEREKKEIKKVVFATGIKDILGKKIAHLSKGYRQRVGLALALLGNPEILILDEPTEGLDPNQRKEIRNLIKSFAKEKTVILSSHILAEIELICQQVIIINKGKLVIRAKVQELASLFSKEKIFLATIEGEKVPEVLKSSEKIKRVKVLEKKNNKYKLEIFGEDEKEIPVILSSLISKNNWILWHFSKREKGLEEVFSLLTKEKI